MSLSIPWRPFTDSRHVRSTAVDVLTKAQRSKCMAAIRGKDTGPEIIVRRLVFAMGFRFRLHASNLIGKPDLIFSRAKKAIFIHGCFWHMHDCRYGRVVPKTNATFWANKRKKTVQRDQLVRTELESRGWQIIEIWECETRHRENLIKQLKKFLSRRSSRRPIQMRKTVLGSSSTT
jgi:DNA mismatch endonuclease (patch repair protein)